MCALGVPTDFGIGPIDKPYQTTKREHTLNVIIFVGKSSTCIIIMMCTTLALYRDEINNDHAL